MSRPSEPLRRLIEMIYGFDQRPSLAPPPVTELLAVADEIDAGAVPRAEINRIREDVHAAFRRDGPSPELLTFAAALRGLARYGLDDEPAKPAEPKEDPLKAHLTALENLRRHVELLTVRVRDLRWHVDGLLTWRTEIDRRLDLPE